MYSPTVSMLVSSADTVTVQLPGEFRGTIRRPHPSGLRLLLAEIHGVWMSDCFSEPSISEYCWHPLLIYLFLSKAFQFPGVCASLVSGSTSMQVGRAQHGGHFEMVAFIDLMS